MTGSSSLVPGVEEEGAGSASAHFTDGVTETHSSVAGVHVAGGGGGGRTLVFCPEVQPGVRGVTGTRGRGHELLPTMASLLSQPLPRQEGHWLTGGRLGRCPPSVNVPSGF